MRGRGGVGVVAGWGEAATDASAERMLATAPHRGSVRLVSHTASGFVGVTGDEGVSGAVEAEGWALAYAGSVDNPETLGLARGADGSRLARALLDAVRRFGTHSALSRLRGFFAVAVITPDAILLGRDHLGLAPLFYRRQGKSVWAASEAKQVVAGAGMRREPDLDVVTAIFFGGDHENLPSAIAGVERVPRAGVVEVSGASRRISTHWEPRSLLEKGDVTEQDLPAVFDELMDQAVRRVMHGRDALSLSGGIDSPAVAAYAARVHTDAYGRPLGAVSYVYPDTPSVDESRYISIVADRLGMPLHTRVPESRPTDDMGRWVKLLDGPFPVVSVAESSEFYGWASSLGYEVLMTGEWAEFVTEMNTHALQHMILTGRGASAWRRYRSERIGGRSARAIARRIAPTLLPDRIRERARRLAGRGDRVPLPMWISERLSVPGHRVPVRERWRRDQLSFFGGTGVMLEAHDVLAAIHRIDVRRPFADIDLWEMFLGLPADIKHGDPRRKGLLRKLLRGRVPDEILDRRDKTTFDENLIFRIDYAALERWLLRPKHRLPWIDYRGLATRLESRALDLREFMWMKDLAAVQAFLEEW